MLESGRWIDCVELRKTRNKGLPLVPLSDEPLDEPVQETAPHQKRDPPVLSHMSWLPAAFFGFLILAAIGVALTLRIVGFFSETSPPVEEGEGPVDTAVAAEPAEPAAVAGEGQQTTADAASGQLPQTDPAPDDPEDNTSEPKSTAAAATTADPRPTVEPGPKPDPPSEPGVNDDTRDTTDTPEPDGRADDPRGADTSATEDDEDNAHPLIVDITKEGYNVWAELKAALDEGAYGDVLRTMRLTPADTPLGLLPDPTDESLFIPFKSLLAVATQDHPQLLDGMQADYGPVAQVRLNAAIADCDAAGVRSVALQFFGTEAAARAHRWLGDRELSAGDFRTAIRHYRQALAFGFAQQSADLNARVRLAGAMLGLDLGDPVTRPVDFNELLMAPADFEEMVAEQRKRNAKLADTSPAQGLPHHDVPPAPEPASYKLRRWTSVDAGQRGWQQIERLHGGGLFPEFDWTPWSLSAAAAGRLVIVSNRQHLTAVDLVTGRHRWTQVFDETRGLAPTWNWVPLRPVVRGDRVYARRIPKLAMPHLACLDVKSGRLRWTSRPDDYVVSQPFWRHERLFALTVSSAESPASSTARRVRRPKSETLQLHLTEFDPISGNVLLQKSLVRFRDQWFGILPCRAAALGSDLVVTVGGAVLCADLDGEIRWLRRQPLSPRKDLLKARGQYHGPPLIVENHIVAFQPGSEAIECLDLATGRIVWQRELSGITRLVGQAEDRLIVQVDSTFAGMDAQDGTVVWEHEPEGLNQALLCGGPGGFAFVDRSAIDFGTWRLDLVWLEPQTGDVAARQFLSEIYRRGRVATTPQCGPFVQAGHRMFLGLPEDKHQPKYRDFYELVVETE
jgi:outer membrane protein assembly factor BamB